jgi:hypothetical protein
VKKKRPRKSLEMGTIEVLEAVLEVIVYTLGFGMKTFLHRRTGIFIYVQSVRCEIVRVDVEPGLFRNECGLISGMPCSE